MEEEGWELTEEEKADYLNRFNDGEGILRGDDRDVAYFERENNRPVRVERFRDKEDNIISIDVDTVPFVGY